MAEHGAHLSEEERRRLIEALADGKAASHAAAEVDVNRDTAVRQRRQLIALGAKIKLSQMDGEAPEAPEERHDREFWRGKAKAAQKEIDGLHARLSDLAALNGLVIREPTWMYEGAQGKRGSATLIVHNSDRHRGEVIEADEINGWNAFNPEIHDRRVKRFMNAACEIGRRWTEDKDVDGVLYTMGGDEISGDIHEELLMTNAATSLEEVQASAGVHVACLRMLADEYGRVHVLAVPGNHGRTTKRKTAKKYGALSYDIMIAKLVAEKLADDERFSFQIAAGPDVSTIIYRRRILLTHGDNIGTAGGQGFVGPMLPIIRGVKKVQAQYSSAQAKPDLVLTGHFHVSGNPPGILANGSVPGLSEFGMTLRGPIEPPKQWLACMTDRWGLRDRCDVQLEEPALPEKPTVRVAAA